MGTRNLTMVISNGKTKVAQYGQWDSYPSVQGLTALSFLKRVISENKLADFKAKIDSLRWLTKKELAIIDKDENWSTNYPHLSRDGGAQILNALFYGEMEVSDYPNPRKVIKVNFNGVIDRGDFAADSLFCEWAYVIDLDKGTFEVYEGFNKQPLTETDRFYPLQANKDKTDEYFPVKLLASFDLNNLPSEQDFLAIEKQEEETEEADKM